MLEFFETRLAHNNKLLENSAFIEILKENWRQVRHLDTMRILLAISYAVLFAATIVYVVHKGGNNLSTQQSILLFIPLLAVSVIWLAVTTRINADIENYLRAIQNTFTEGKILLCEKEFWYIFVGLPRSTGGGINKWFTLGNCCIAFYSLVGAASLGVIVYVAV